MMIAITRRHKLALDLVITSSTPFIPLSSRALLFLAMVMPFFRALAVPEQ